MSFGVFNFLAITIESYCNGGKFKNAKSHQNSVRIKKLKSSGFYMDVLKYLEKPLGFYGYPALLCLLIYFCSLANVSRVFNILT